MRRLMGLALLVVVATVSGTTAGAPAEAIRVWLHAHNCYPDRGHGVDRLMRALDTAAGTVAIEQDLVWDAVRGVPVVAHETALTGAEPTLDEHFFAAVAPQLDRALAEGDRAAWPRIVLHLDFKTNEPAHHAAVWDLLGRYERWLTTAPRTASGAVAPFNRGPLLVLTEHGEGQERAFYDAVPMGGRLRLFGTVPAAPIPEGLSLEARADLAIAAPAEIVIASPATNYRRWTNHAWAVVERGGPPRAADWTAPDRARLEALVGRAHDLGLWIRFYTLNGHPPDVTNTEGWSAGYNFGSAAAVEARWRAAIAAGVDFIATDQYEAFSGVRQQMR